MHPSTEAILEYFHYDHLPDHLAEASKPFCELAKKIASGPQGPETTACLRKLLEAKDCAVRIALTASEDLDARGRDDDRRRG